MGARKPEEGPTCPPGHSHSSHCYKRHHCRCPECRASNSRDNSKYTRRRSLKKRKPGVRVSSIQSARKIQGLNAIGWSNVDIGKLVGVDDSYISKLARQVFKSVQVATHVRIDRAYKKLHMTPGENSSVKRRALAKGYLPPLEWDDIDRGIRYAIETDE